MIALVAWAHKGLENLNCSIHGSSFIYEGLISEQLLLSRWRKFFLLRFNVLKLFYHSLIMLLHSSFLLKSHDDLLEYKRMRLNFFVSLSTSLCKCQLLSLEQSQNLTLLFDCSPKNLWKYFDITIVWFWNRCIVELKNFLAACKVSVIMIIWKVLEIWVA